MAPLHTTPEYTLLRRLVDEGDIHFTQLNMVALTNAKNEGYVELIGDYVHITDAGYDRLDQLEE